MPVLFICNFAKLFSMQDDILKLVIIYCMHPAYKCLFLDQDLSSQSDIFGPKVVQPFSGSESRHYLVLGFGRACVSEDKDCLGHIF